MNQPADIFHLKPTERHCPRCTDGRLNVERLSDHKANHYCDSCQHFQIYEIPLPPMPEQPGPTPTPTQEAPMPQGTPTGLTKTQYLRWYAAGKPDLDKFKAAGCPTAKEWAAGMGAGEDPASSPDMKTKGKKERKAQQRTKDKPLPEPAEPTKRKADTTLTIEKARVRLVVVDYEGDLGAVLNQLGDLIRRAI